MLNELKDIARGEAYIGGLSSVDIAFTKIPNVCALSRVHNLITLTLICAQTTNLQGIEATGHSLETLDVIGCGLQTIQSYFLSLTALRNLNLGENRIAQIQNLTK